MTESQSLDNISKMIETLVVLGDRIALSIGGMFLMTLFTFIIMASYWFSFILGGKKVGKK